MAASLKDIKSRIVATEKTGQITKAMEMVSSTKIRKFEKNITNIRTYIRETTKTIIDIPSEHLGVYSLDNKADKVGYIVITSDKSLAGSYNSSVIKALENKIKDSQYGAYAYIYGRQGVENISHRDNITIRESNFGFGDNIDMNVVKSVFTKALDDFKSGKINSLEVIVSDYVNQMTQEVEIIELLPLDDRKLIEKHLKMDYVENPSYIEFDITDEAVNIIIESFLTTIVFCFMQISKTAEYAARQMAMKNATDNAQEIKTKLNLYYNRKRQEAITTELSEIVSGTL